MMKWFGSTWHLLLFTLLLFTSSLIGCLGTSRLPSWLSGFRYRVPITLEEKSGTTLKDYQIKIAIQGADVNQPWCVDFSRIQPDGQDVRFVDETHRLLDFWIQAWDNTTKKAIIWIKVPQVKAITPSILYLYYGNPQAKSLSSFDNTMQKLQVDETTAGLWHFDGSGKKVLDSSPHKNHSSFFQTSWVNKDGGVISSCPHYCFSKGNALAFNGQDEYVEFPYHSSLDFSGTERISLEAWIYPVRDNQVEMSDNVSKETNPSGIRGQYSAILVKRGMYALYLNAEGKVACYLWGPKPMVYHTSKGSLPSNQWSHIAVTYNGRRISFYLNGRLDNEIAVSDLIRPVLDHIHPEGPQDRKASLYIGNDPNSEYPRFFHGRIDEVRILRRILSEGEVKADYERRAYAPVEPELSLGEEERQGE